MATSWTSEKVYFNGDDYFDAMVRAIDRASTTIEFEVYIFYADEMGRWMEQAFIRAARRGVRVRVLVDGIGALSWIGHWSPELFESGVRLKIWNPVYVGPFLRDVVRSLLKGRLWLLISSTNRRTHRKYCIIDGQRAFVGSQNVSRLHSRRFAGTEAWRDSGVEIEGREIESLTQAFNYAWDRSYRPDGLRRWINRRSAPSLGHESLVRLNYKRAIRRRFRKDFLARIRAAQKRVWITNAYFLPTGPLLKALFSAAKQGVDVRLLVPSRSDIFFMRWVAKSFYGALLTAGVRVFEYQPTFLHAKTALIDDWLMVGTSNLNTRSFLHDLEVDIVVTGDESRRQVETQYLTDLSHSHEVDLETLRSQRSMRILGRIVSLLLRHWL